MNSRTCSKCGKEFPLTEEHFNRNQSTNTGGNKYWRPECKLCTRKGYQGRREAHKLAGKPVAPPLGTPCDNCGRCDKPLRFDHCHHSLKHRGWLCENCNQGAGRLGDTVESVLELINYMNKTEKKIIAQNKKGDLHVVE